MKILLFIILLLPGLKLVDYAVEQSARLDEKPALAAKSVVSDRSDVYLHLQREQIGGKEQYLKTNGRGKLIAKGLIVSLVVIISIGLVRQRSMR
ncbi:hypothetical protein [Larkinella rosea]|uniref:Uncharacterized protein n=1 Tax=Larkinella rosea TaxID=2025312 RepID=A0A3P1BZP6_9BACT|nr:hypothetical protein [Larkinella rosea]RRB06399.1 hypothetical protein EHT25_00930 [Larkinella rosea]